MAFEAKRDPYNADAPNRDRAGAMARVKAASLRSALRGLDPHHALQPSCYLSERRPDLVERNV